MNSTFQNYTNPESRFVTGTIIQHLPGAVFDFRLRGSNERKPANWEDIAFTVDENESECVLKFSKPENYVHFQFEVLGGGGSPIDVIFEFFQPRPIEAARAYLKSRSIAFLGCARNCSEYVERNILHLARLGDLFKEYKIYVFENDSNDDTLDKLINLANHINIELITRKNLDASLPTRGQRLSFARNKLLAKFFNKDFDYFCVSDMDDVLGEKFSIDGFIDNFRFDGCWDACFPVNEAFYYDLWALRHPQLCPGDYQVPLNRLNYNFGTENSLSFYVKPLQRFRFDRLAGWLAVDSAFGGMGVYKTASFASCRYFGIDHDNEICEHVPFHQMARRQGARLYINPKFVVKGLDGKQQLP